jgi:hypothetical protein
MRVKKLGSPTAKNEEQVFSTFRPLLLTQRYSVHNRSSSKTQNWKTTFNPELPPEDLNIINTTLK